MARRKAATPNLPADTLARARAQAGVPTPTTASDVPEATTAEPTLGELIEAAPSTSQRRIARPTSKRLQDAQYERSRKRGELDQDTIKERLLNPTSFPTAADLKRDYTFVVKDLRSMFLLSAALIVLLIGIATVAP